MWANLPWSQGTEHTGEPRPGAGVGGGVVTGRDFPGRWLHRVESLSRRVFSILQNLN